MRKVTRTIGTIVSAASLVLAPALAEARSNDTPMRVGPPISDVQSPYMPAQQCVKVQLQGFTEQQRETTFTVMSFIDKTAKFNAVSDSGTGAFSPQDVSDMVYTSLGLTGVMATDLSPAQRALMDWSIPKYAAHNASTAETHLPKLNVGYKFADVAITGAISTFDVNFASNGGSLKIFGIGGGHHNARILAGMDARLNELLGGARLDGTPNEAGKQVGVVRISKQIVGDETSLGATGFFGGGAGTLVEFDIGSRKNEAIQYVERVMIDGLVVRLVTKYFGITACDDLIAYGDRLLVPTEPPEAVAATTVAAEATKLASAK